MSRSKLWLVLVIACTFAVYAPSFANGFTYDDAVMVRVPSAATPNEFVRDVQPLGAYFTTTYSASSDASGRGFRPITMLSFALVHHFFESSQPPRGGPEAPAWPQHVVNVVLHCVATWLTYLLLALFVGVGIPAVLGAAVFGLHALRSDPVISIVGRGEIMAYGFGVGGLLLYVAALRRSASVRPGGARVGRLAGCAVLLFLAFCSKESAAPWLVMLPLCVVALRLGGETGLPDWRGQLGPWVLAVGVPFSVFFGLLLNVWSGLEEEFSQAYANNPLWHSGGLVRVATAVIILGYGFCKVFFPLHLVSDYSAEVFRLAEGFGDYRFWVALVGLAVVLGLGVVGARRWPLLLVAVALFFGFSFLTSNVPMPIETIFGERLYYTPAASVSCLVAWGLHRVRGPKFKVAIGLIAAWLLVCCVLIVGRTLDWRDNETLFFADAEAQPRSIRLQMTLMQYLRRGDPRIWKQKIDQAHALNEKAPGPLQELSFFWARMGDFAQAEKFARLGLATDHVDRRDNLDSLRLQLARALVGANKTAEAEQEFRRVIEIRETASGRLEPQTRVELAQLYAWGGQAGRARRELDAIVRQVPGFLPAWDQLLHLAQASGRDAEVEQLIARGRAAMPRAATFELHEGIMLHRRGDKQRAAQIFDQWMPGMPRVPQTVEYWVFYARILAARGQLEPARRIVGEFLSMGLPGPQRAPLLELARQLGMPPPR